MELSSWQVPAVVAAVLAFLYFFGKRLAVASGAAAIADNCYVSVFLPRPVQNAPGEVPAPQNAPRSGSVWSWIGIVAILVFFIGGATVCDVYFQTTHVQTIINATVYQYDHWVRTLQEETRKGFERDKLCSKMGDDVLNQIEVMMQDVYKSNETQGLLSDLKHLIQIKNDYARILEERNSLIAERDAGRDSRHVSETELNQCMAKTQVLSTEARSLSDESKILKGSVRELKRDVANITSIKNDCEANLTQTTILLKSCRRKKDEEAQLAAKKCWL
jgi:hypothetical protein